VVSCVRTISLDSTILEDISKRGWSLSALVKFGYEMKKEQKTLADFETKREVELNAKIERLATRLSEMSHRVFELEDKKDVREESKAKGSN